MGKKKCRFCSFSGCNCEQEAPLTCPRHGQLIWAYVTTMKTCGLCMEEDKVDAGRATRLIRGIR